MEINVSGVVDSLCSTAATRRRHDAGSSNAAGVWIDGATTDTSILASFQRPSPAARKVLPEAIRGAVRWLIYTTADLRGVDESSQQRADQVIHAGQTFEVVALAGWSEHGGYTRAALTRAEV